MDANSLLFYLRGVFESCSVSSPGVFELVRNAVLSAKPVENQLIPVEVKTKGGCSCGGKCGGNVNGH